MNCIEFCQCVNEITWRKVKEKSTRKSRAKRKKERNLKPKEETVFENYPCNNIQRLRKCVCYADDRSQPSCSEHGKTYTLIQGEKRNNILCMHVDGGILDEIDSNKCDYLFLVMDHVDGGNGRAIFIELKGSATRDALAQLKATIKSPAFQGIELNYKKIYGRIVNTSSVPNIQSAPDFIELKEIFLRLGGNLKTHEWNFLENYDELD